MPFSGSRSSHADQPKASHTFARTLSMVYPPATVTARDSLSGSAPSSPNPPVASPSAVKLAVKPFPFEGPGAPEASETTPTADPVIPAAACRASLSAEVKL